MAAQQARVLRHDPPRGRQAHRDARSALGRAEGHAGRLSPLSDTLAAGPETFAVTGASGWFGLTTLELLHAAGAGSRVRAYASRARTLTLRDGTEIEARPLVELEPADIVLHYAYLTRERGGEGSYVHDNVAITARVLDALGAARGLLYLSSGAAYQPGGIDENPYAALKRLDEFALRSAARDAGARCAVARVFNVAGPYMTKPELYALGDFIQRARAGEPIVIRATGRVERSYVLAADVVTVALGWLLESDTPDEVVFDTAGDEVVEVEDLARRVARVLGVPDLPIERTLDPGAPANVYVGDGARLRALADRLGVRLAGLDEQIVATAQEHSTTLPLG